MGIESKNFAKITEEAIKKAFGIKTEVDMETKIAKAEEQTEEPKTETIDVKNTWVWVEGYKGTDKDMCCQGFQYELGKVYQMHREEVEECKNGYHCCLNLNDVFSYYHIGNGHRFFKVRALVRLSDKNEYGMGGITYDFKFGLNYNISRNKLVAAEIEFLEELTIDEILSNTRASAWTDEYKKLALEIGIDEAERKMRITDLTDLGYSLPFASYILSKKKYNVAKAVGSQPELSMEMRALLIMQD